MSLEDAIGDRIVEQEHKDAIEHMLQQMEKDSCTVLIQTWQRGLERTGSFELKELHYKNDDIQAVTLHIDDFAVELRVTARFIAPSELNNTASE